MPATSSTRTAARPPAPTPPPTPPVARTVATAIPSPALPPDRFGVEALFEQCPFGFALVGLDHRFQRVNPAFAAIAGHPVEALVGRPFEEITHPADLVREAHLVGRTYAGELPYYELEKRYVRNDGGDAPVRVTAFVLRDEQGRVLGAVKMIRPVVARRTGTTDADGHSEGPMLGRVDALRQVVLG